MIKRIITIASIVSAVFYLKESFQLINPFLRPGAYFIHKPEISILIMALVAMASVFFLIKLFIKKNEFKNNYLLSLLIIIFLIICAKILYSLILPFTNDEGSYLYDSLLLSQGSSPFYFSFARSPVLVYLLSIFIRLFGPNLFIGRLFSIAVSLMTSLFIFNIGKLYKNERFGFISASIFMISSSLIYDNLYIHTQSLTYMFVILSFYLLLKFIMLNDRKSLVFSYITLSFAILTRETTVFYVPLWAIFTLFPINIKNLKIKFTNLVIGGLSLIIVFGLVWMFIGMNIGFVKVYYNLTALAGMREGESNVFELIKSKSLLFEQNFIYIIGLLMFFFTSISNHFLSISKKYKTFLQLVFSFFLIQFIKWIPSVIVFSHLENYYVFIVCIVSLYSIYMWMNFLVLSTNDKTVSKSVDNYLVLYLFGLFAVPFLFYYLYYSNFQTEYFIEILIPATILFSYLFSFQLNKSNNFFSNPWLFLAITTIFSINLFSIYRVTISPQRGTYPIENLLQITDYLHKNYPNREVFTAAVIIPFVSRNNLALNITHPAIYCNCTQLSDKVIYTLFPKEEEIIKYLDSRKVKVVLVEKITNDVYFSHRPNLKQYVDKNYTEKNMIGLDNPIKVMIRN